MINYSIEDINQLRVNIEKIDYQLIELLGNRQTLAQEIGKIKAKLGLEILNNDVWNNASIVRQKLAKKYEIDPELVHEIYELIHQASLKKQEIKNDK
jgi:chorismate mutase